MRSLHYWMHLLLLPRAGQHTGSAPGARPPSKYAKQGPETPLTATATWLLHCITTWWKFWPSGAWAMRKKVSYLQIALLPTTKNHARFSTAKKINPHVLGQLYNPSTMWPSSPFLLQDTTTPRGQASTRSSTLPPSRSECPPFLDWYI